MDITIALVLIAFLSLIGTAFFYFTQEGQGSRPGSKLKALLKPAAQKPAPDPGVLLQKRTAAYEEKLKQNEAETLAVRRELAQALEREEALKKEKAAVSFDSEQYEKFKKEFAHLKNEVKGKEETLEQEIAARRQQAAEAALARQENDQLKKRVMAAEDDSRKTHALLEKTTLELNETRKKLQELSRASQEQHVNKSQGQWVAREEFDKIERELKEKDLFIKKIINVNPPAGPGATAP